MRSSTTPSSRGSHPRASGSAPPALAERAPALPHQTTDLVGRLSDEPGRRFLERLQTGGGEGDHDRRVRSPRFLAAHGAHDSTRAAAIARLHRIDPGAGSGVAAATPAPEREVQPCAR